MSLQVGALRPARATVVRRGRGVPTGGVHVGLPSESDRGADTISALPAAAGRGPIVAGRTDENGQWTIAHIDPSGDTLRVVGQKIFARRCGSNGYQSRGAGGIAHPGGRSE